MTTQAPDATVEALAAAERTVRKALRAHEPDSALWMDSPNTHATAILAALPGYRLVPVEAEPVCPTCGHPTRMHPDERGCLHEACFDRFGLRSDAKPESRCGEWWPAHEVAEPAGLDVAWKAAEAALPEGWALTVGSIVKRGARSVIVYWSGAGSDPDDPDYLLGGKDSPAEALTELAARLSESHP